MTYWDRHTMPEDYGSTERAGFRRRLCAAFIDGIILGILDTALIVALHRSGHANAISQGRLDVIGFLIALVYYTMLEGGLSGQTVGKRAVGIRVVSYEDGGPIGYGNAFLRFFARYVSALVLFLGYLWMIWDHEKQCWHDKLANDLVVPIADFPYYKPIRV